MKDETTTSIVETEFEAEAQMYEELLKEHGLHAQVRTVEDPYLNNIVRRIAPPHYQVVVLKREAAMAKDFIAQQQLQTEPPTLMVYFFSRFGVGL